MKYKLVVLLTGFETDNSDPLPKQIKLSNGWSLKEAGKFNLEVVAEYVSKMINDFQKDEITSTSYLLVKRIELETDDPNAYANSQEVQEAIDEAKWICTSLRLIKPSVFIGHKVLCEQRGRHLRPIKATTVIDRFYLPSGYSVDDGDYSAKDAGAIRVLAAKVLEFAAAANDPYHRILNAVDIFNEAFKQNRYETKLILLVTAIESIYACSNRNVLEQFTMGASRYLIEDVGKREAFAKRVKQLYGVRSSMVHGDVPDKKFLKDHSLQTDTIKLAYEIITLSIVKIILKKHYATFASKELLKHEYELIKLGGHSVVFR